MMSQGHIWRMSYYSGMIYFINPEFKSWLLFRNSHKMNKHSTVDKNPKLLWQPRDLRQVRPQSFVPDMGKQVAK